MSIVKLQGGRKDRYAHKFMNIGAGFLCCLMALSCGQGCAADLPPQVCSAKKCFSVDMMSTPEQREQGLMFYASLPEDQGMFFIFEESGRYPFWMKNMKFAIDILWIDENKRIVDIKDHVPACEAEPCTVYTPKSNARYVLELSAGAAQANGLKVGEELKIPNTM